MNKRTVSPRSSSKTKPRQSFPIVGIGGSAGALEALRHLLAKLPEPSDLAFVIIQHLDPTHKSMAPEILARITSIPVKEIKSGTLIKPNCIYVAPSNRIVGLSRGTLKLFPLSKATEHLPIDYFFHQLARDLKTRAVGMSVGWIG